MRKFDNIIEFGSISLPHMDSLPECVLYEPSVVSPLYSTSVCLPDGRVVSVISTDVTLLFNQQRLSLDKATTSYLEGLCSSFRNEDAFKGYSDEDIISTIKSRYLQKSHEILNWIDSLGILREDLLDALRESHPEVDPSNPEQPGIEQPGSSVESST